MYAHTDTREHDTTRDALRDLGRSGVTFTGHAYAWNARRGAYDYTNTFPTTNDRVTRYMVTERPHAGSRAWNRPRWPMRVSQRNARADVRVATIATARDANVRALVV
jgi:hypothetical protein